MTYRSHCPQEISAADQAYCMLHSPRLWLIPGLFRLICDRAIRALRGKLLYFHEKCIVLHALKHGNDLMCSCISCRMLNLIFLLHHCQAFVKVKIDWY